MNRKLRWLFCPALVAGAMLIGLRSASADSLPIDSSLSTMTVGLQVGIDDPDNPGTFLPFAAAVGQGGVLPTGPFTGGVIPGFSNGLSTRVTGSMNVTVAGPTITLGPGSTINLLDSGDWQPGTNPDGSGAPLPAEIAGYLLASFLGVDDLEGILTLNNSAFDILATGSLDGGGNFNDPAGAFNIINTDITGRVVDVLASIDTTFSQPSGPQSSVGNIGGNFNGSILVLPFAATVIIDLGDLAPGLLAQVAVDGVIVTLPVPEPSSVVLMGLATGAVGLVAVRRRAKN